MRIKMREGLRMKRGKAREGCPNLVLAEHGAPGTLSSRAAFDATAWFLFLLAATTCIKRPAPSMLGVRTAISYLHGHFCRFQKRFQHGNAWRTGNAVVVMPDH